MDEIYVTYVDDEHVDNHDYDDTTDDDHEITMISMFPYVSGPDPGRTRAGPRPDQSGPGWTEPDQSKIHYIQSKYRVDHCLQSWIGPRVQL